MSTVLDPMASPAPGSLLSSREKFQLGSRLALAGSSAALLALSVVVRTAWPAEADTARLVAALAAALIAVPVLTEAWNALRSPSLHGITDLLVAAALISAWALDDLETAALVPLAMVLGHVLEERSLLGSRDAIAALARLGHQRARRLAADGTVTEIASTALRIGDRIDVRAGDRLPADGLVRVGSSAIDASALTGESLPIEVTIGDVVQAGTINRHGRLEVEVLRLGGDTALGRVVQLVQEAEHAKPPVTRLLERFAMPYLALVLLGAATALMLGGTVTTALALLVAACPCALVLAAPATAVAAIATAARFGILVKGTAFLEELAEVDALVIDKTGTLTVGELRIAQVLPEPGYEIAQVLVLAGALGAASSHPVSRAVARAGDATQRQPLADVVEHSGGGVAARLGTDVVVLGRPGLLTHLGVSVGEVPAHHGPLVGVARGGRFLGWITLDDEPREEARHALADLAREGVTRQVLLTGDRASAAHGIAARLGLTEVHADATPADKLAVVRALTAAGRRPLVVGDGINDVLALKAGAVGVAMGAAGTDAALASADLVLTGSDLRRLGTGLRLSRRCRTIIAQNVAMGLCWTIVVVALVTYVGLGPVWAVLLHHIGTLAVVVNSGRVLGFEES